MHKMEYDMNEDAFRTSSEHEASIQPDSHPFSFTNTQIQSDSQGTPKKFPSAPHPSPVMSPVPNVVSSDNFEYELLKACYKFCDQTELIEDTLNDRSTAMPSTSAKKLSEITAKESEYMPTFSVITNPLADILETASSSSPIKRKSGTSPRELDTETYSQKLGLQRICPDRLVSSMSNFNLRSCPNSPFSENESVFGQCESEISDFSATGSKILPSPEYTLRPVNQIKCDERCSDEDGEEKSDKSDDKENYDKVNMEFPINTWEVYSPRRPRSSVGKFLNWRKNKAIRTKRGTSVDSVYTPRIRRNIDDDDSKFPMTI